MVFLAFLCYFKSYTK